MKKWVVYGGIAIGLSIVLYGIGQSGVFATDVPETCGEVCYLTDFEKGEYYFNHDDDPAGPYDIKLARQYYEAALAASSTANAAVWYQLGRIDFLEGKFHSALHKFEQQWELFPDSGVNPDYMIGLTYGYLARKTGETEHWDAAAAGFERFITFKPGAPWPRVDLAWVYFAQGKYVDMIPVLEEGLEYAPGNAWLLNMYGLALMNTGESERAHDMFVAAQEAADLLTATDWGKSYPGNNPAYWEQGLNEFKAAIAKNVALVE